MKIPNKIKIGGIWWTVKLVPSEEVPTDETAELLYDKQLIKIDEDLSDELILLNFWHEALHASNNQLEESEVEWFAQTITQIILDNKL